MPIRTTLALALLGLGPALCLAREAPKFAPMPHKVSSFGACVSDGWLYVYGGHTGKVHTYSTETATGKFFRARLSGGKWEELPGGPAAQGLGLVAHRGKLVRVGGMQPRNPPGQKADNHSLTSCARYDPAARKWEALPDLPQGRSSHDAIVVGDRLYVVGGWKLNGVGKAPTWHDTMLVLDLAKAPLKWQTIEQPFRRRALAAEAVGGKVYVLGGLTERGGAVGRVDVYDPASGKWSAGPALPGEGAGFSPAACVLGGRLYAGTNDGRVHRLRADGAGWEPVGRLQVRRHVSRMVAGDGTLLVLGGSAAAGDSRTVEAVAVAAGRASSK